MRIYAYCRVSSRGQIDGDGIPRQREAIRAFCEQHKLDHCGEFAEKGVPGKTEGANRPAWSDMLDCIKNRRDNGTDIVDAVVVERMDRLARDLIVSEMLLTELRNRRIQIFATDQGLIDIASNDGDPTQKLIRQVIAAVAEFSKSELVKKLRLARERAKHARGQTKGEAAIYALIQKMYAEGNSFRKIERFLGEEGILTSNGKPYQLSRLWAVVKKGTECTDQQQSVL